MMNSTSTIPTSAKALAAAPASQATVPAFGFMASASAQFTKMEESTLLRNKEYSEMEAILVDISNAYGIAIESEIRSHGLKVFDANAVLEEEENNLLKFKDRICDLEEYVNETMKTVRCAVCNLSGMQSDDPACVIYKRYLTSFNKEAFDAFKAFENMSVRYNAIRALTLIAFRVEVKNLTSAVYYIDSLRR